MANVDASNITHLTGQRRLGQLDTIQATANIILTEQMIKAVQEQISRVSVNTPSA